MKPAANRKNAADLVRPLAVWTGCALLLAGCATGPPRSSVPAAEVVAPVATTEARVTLVNTDFGFVVLDFSGATVPAAGTPLEVYRNEQRVGKVRVTEPMRGPFTTADILEGDLQVGDRVPTPR